MHRTEARENARPPHPLPELLPAPAVPHQAIELAFGRAGGASCDTPSTGQRAAIERSYGWPVQNRHRTCARPGGRSATAGTGRRGASVFAPRWCRAVTSHPRRPRAPLRQHQEGAHWLSRKAVSRTSPGRCRSPAIPGSLPSPACAGTMPSERAPLGNRLQPVPHPLSAGRGSARQGQGEDVPVTLWHDRRAARRRTVRIP